MDKVFLEVSRDNMSVHITILDEALKDEEEILKVLKINRITYGIDYEKIKNIKNMPGNIIKEEIAMGIKCIDGKDGNIDYLFKTEKNLKPKLNSDGTVNYKELDLINKASQDDILAKKQLPTIGQDGKDVYGREVRAKIGKESNIKYGKNVVLSDDGMYVYAQVDGQIIYEDGKISISDTYEINSNVDNTTGNINFNGDVIIRGNVRTGFEVETTGNVEIFGVVEGAKVTAKGDIVIHKGIQGHDTAVIKAGGNLNCQYIQNSKIDIQKNLFADIIMHSNVEVKGSIYAKGKKGLIVGGELYANEEIHANIIGSNMATITKIETGSNPEKKRNLREKEEELKTISKNRNNVIKAIKLLSKIKDTPLFTEDKKQIYEKSVKTNEYLKNKEIELNDLIDELEQKLEKSKSNGFVKVYDRAYQGVKVVINSSVYYVRDEVHNIKFEDDGSGIKITNI